MSLNLCFINNSMNKADLVNLVAARTELTKTDVSLVVDAAIETIVDSVVEGKKVSLLGFGSFEPRDRSARQGLNPKTGEKIAIPAKRVPTFSAGKLFKDRVQGWYLFKLDSFCFIRCSSRAPFLLIKQTLLKGYLKFLFF